MASTDEYVMDTFVTLDKIDVLIYDLLLSEVWKENVYPLVKKEVGKMTSIRSYMLMYHEASVCNLLEVLLFHRTAVESSEDAIVELIDYCYRKLVDL